MGDQLVPNGTYTVMDPGGTLTDGDGAIVLLEPRKDKNQQWEVKVDSGTYILRNTASGTYPGDDGDPNEVAMQVKGSRQPCAWKLSTGNDDSEKTLLLTSAASQDGFVLTHSLLRIYPPQLAILPPDEFRPPAEWVLTPV